LSPLLLTTHPEETGIPSLIITSITTITILGLLVAMAEHLVAGPGTGLTPTPPSQEAPSMSNKLKRIEALQSILIERMLEDLRTPDKCTPGLYQVIRGIITDNREQLDAIPMETLTYLEDKFKDSIPFKRDAS